MDDRRPDYQFGQTPRNYQQPMTYARPQPLPGVMPANVLDQTQKMTSTGFKPLSILCIVHHGKELFLFGAQFFQFLRQLGYTAGEITGL